MLKVILLENSLSQSHLSLLIMGTRFNINSQNWATVGWVQIENTKVSKSPPEGASKYITNWQEQSAA